MFLPRAIYSNRVEPKEGDFVYVVPQNDSIEARMREVTSVSAGTFEAEGYHFSWTRSACHLGHSVLADAYESVASYQTIRCFLDDGWTQRTPRRDVFSKVYVNSRIKPSYKTEAFVQIDHDMGRLVLNGWYLGEGCNLLEELSRKFFVLAEEVSPEYKIRSFLSQADVIILASYAMNLKPLEAPPKVASYKGSIASVRRAFFEGQMENEGINTGASGAGS